MKKTFYKRYGKRILDLCIGIPLFIGILPILFIVGLLVFLMSGGPILFFQERLAINGRKFLIIKFRTMNTMKKKNGGEIFADHPDVTWIGKLLRRTKIDELPQLWNIIYGDLSFIGPRPLLPESINQFTEIARKRLDVPQGLASLTEVNGNIYLDWNDRWCYDAEYVDKQSFLLDTEIFFRSILVVVFGEEQYLRPYQGKYKSDLKNENVHENIRNVA
ncbi:MAG: sugar transferase [Bacteroidales bacterium]|jgi:lipopolysaccharide/colanic/teichoic acid biosynthesis glycosyltransferase|nr:sugar transferase [Bacteroidales bacterium]